jgi:hypothetical protein
LLWAEQGLGDTLQFIRFAPLVKKRGATVFFECQRALRSVLAGCPGVDRLIPRGSPLPPFDFHAPLLSVPRLVETTLATIPADVPYLVADPNLVALWREKLSSAGEFRIGINWQGRVGPHASPQRDIPLEHFRRLAALPGVCLISLQKGAGREAWADRSSQPWILDPGDHVDEAHGAFTDTAAIMRNLDLIVTSDTSIPHLAGALGAWVWIALPFDADWRWLLGRSDTPWYPTMRLFRQPQPGDWNSVFTAIEAALQLAMASARPRASN